MTLILIAGRQPLYRLSVINLLRQCAAGLTIREADTLDQFSNAQLNAAEGLILCGPDQSVADLDNQLLLSGCDFTTLRVLFSDRLGATHRRRLADGTVDLILPMAVSWSQAQSYLQRLLVYLEPSVGFQALQDPELSRCFLPDINDLTHREQRVLRHLNEGLSNEAIAQQMAITINKVKVHMAKICRKTGVSNRTQAVCLFERTQVVAY